jgi:hypothetical protein
MGSMVTISSVLIARLPLIGGLRTFLLVEFKRCKRGSAVSLEPREPIASRPPVGLASLHATFAA